jgi:hypothetical protein
MQDMPDPAPIHEHAFDNLRYIREAMERASAFTSIPGRGGAAVGVSAVAAAVVAHPYVDQPVPWLGIWLAEAVVATIVGWTAMILKARRANVSFTGAPARRFFAAYLAPIVAAALLTLFLARAGHFAALPAVWLLLYGAAFISTGSSSIPVVPVMGACFMAAGIASGFTSPAVANAILGAAFGGLHIAFGVVIARRYGG